MPLVPQFMEQQARIISDIEFDSTEDEQSATTSFSLFDENVKIPNLEILDLSSTRIHKIWSDQPSSNWFQNLIKLTLSNCDNLTYLCSLSVILCLNKLKSISIRGCSRMEKLFIIEGTKNEYSKACIFPKLEQIELSGMNMLKDIWPSEDEVSADSFPSLISLSIINCNKIEKIFPDHIRCWYLSLKSLLVYSCKLVEFIFENRCLQQENDTKSASLEVIYLSNLPNLKQLWSVDPKGVVNFTNLQSMEVYSCDRLSNVLPASIATDLLKLESCSIHWCKNLEEIIAWDTESETSNEELKLMFPEVISLSLYYLPSIRYFYKGRYIVECPRLKQLTVIQCPNMEIFTTESADEERRVPLSTKKVMSQLEYLNIDTEGVQWLVSNKGKYHLNSLTHLHFESWEILGETLYCFLHTIPNLQVLNMSPSWIIQEFVPSGNTAQKQRLGTVLLLKEFTLYDSGMEDIGFERDPALQISLCRLVLNGCWNLSRLASSSVSFAHLTYLEVTQCHGLKTLLTCSTAKSLVQLTTLKQWEL
ncbi:hypothetical protein PIB30_118545 [Stylosanthes scabra]|uniref:Disease resistance protein At4g27190-like leucine-rich repeats domain-containing protein n=1 Tax=Stylosanthes scabra TaxID=79078 RepID=A0ABU6ZJL7_9FABA|nr:hypothetical protein [Stylosanthes scabra]